MSSKTIHVYAPIPQTLPILPKIPVNSHLLLWHVTLENSSPVLYQINWDGPERVNHSFLDQIANQMQLTGMVNIAISPRDGNIYFRFSRLERLLKGMMMLCMCPHQMVRCPVTFRTIHCVTGLGIRPG
jgi:hypothetical protein